MTLRSLDDRLLGGRLRRHLRPSPIERQLSGLALGPGDFAIDCGANVGDVTAVLARAGAVVHAFEPNPAAFEMLARRFSATDNVVLHSAAVFDRDGRERLYLHVDDARDPVGSSVGSSMLEFKGNVDASRYVEVETIDLARFVLELEQPVALVKIDVEGVECPVVHRLLDSGAINRIGTVLVEVHDHHIPQLCDDYDRLRERLAREGLERRVLTDWQ